MKKMILLILFYTLFLSCENGTTGNSGKSGGNTLTVNVINIPISANGNQVYIAVAASENESAQFSIEDGGAESPVVDGTATSIIYDSTIAGRF